jgi:hypothetical protein
MQALAVKISTAVGTAPALISVTRADPNFATKQASWAGVIVEGEGSVDGLIPTDSRAFFCESERLVWVVFGVVVEFELGVGIAVFSVVPNIIGFILKGSATYR